MNCHQLDTLLIEYLDGRLHPGERSTVEHHLTSCAGCKARAEGFRSVSQVLEAWEAPETSPWFNARLRRRIASFEAAHWDWRAQLRFLLKPVYAAAMGTMLVVGSLALWNSRPGTAPKTVTSAEHQRMDEIIPVVDDYEILANFEVLTDLKKDQGTL